jgi:hypothetical protein
VRKAKHPSGKLPRGIEKKSTSLGKRLVAPGFVTYRIYIFDSDDEVIWPPRLVDCPDDASALMHANDVTHGKRIEVWQELRLVFRLDVI